MSGSDEAESKITVNIEELVKGAKNGDVSVFNSLSKYELIDALAFRNTEGHSLLQIAAFFGNNEVVKFISEAENVTSKGFIDTENEDDIHLADAEEIQIALHNAITSGWDIIVRMLLSRAVDIHGKDENGFTPLHCSASTGNLEMCEFLLDKDVEIDEVCNAGRTPLMMAVINEQTEVALLLIRQGADWTNLDKAYDNGPSIRERASEDLNKAIVDTLRELGMFYDQPGFRASRFLPLPPGVRRV